jgi:hypothetical protein
MYENRREAFSWAAETGIQLYQPSNLVTAEWSPCLITLTGPAFLVKPLPLPKCGKTPIGAPYSRNRRERRPIQVRPAAV